MRLVSGPPPKSRVAVEGTIWRKRVRVERSIDIARCQSPVLKICSPTSLLCGLNNLASRYVVLFGLNCATRHATMQPNMQPHAGGARNPSGHIFPIPCHSEPDSLLSNETPGAPQLNSLTVPPLMDGRCSHHPMARDSLTGLFSADQSPFAPIPNILLDATRWRCWRGRLALAIRRLRWPRWQPAGGVGQSGLSSQLRMD